MEGQEGSGAGQYRAALRMADIEPLLPLDRTFDALYGLEVIESNDELVRAQVKVRDEIKQPMGLVHGGIYASIAESITSTATAMAVWPEGKAAQGMSNQTSFLRPITQRHDPRRGPPPPPRPHDVGVGGRHHRRRGPPVRPRADDDRGAGDHAALTAARARSPRCVG